MNLLYRKGFEEGFHRGLVVGYSAWIEGLSATLKTASEAEAVAMLMADADTLAESVSGRVSDFDMDLPFF